MLKQDLVQSVDDARLHHQLFPDEVLYENDFDPVSLFFPQSIKYSTSVWEIRL